MGERRARSGPADGKVVLVRGPDLPTSATELDQLREVYPDAIVLDGEQATTEAVLSAMDGAKLVHIAAHGTHEPANALFSRLELFDGGLLAHEVARLHRPPDAHRARRVRAGAVAHPARRRAARVRRRDARERFAHGRRGREPGRAPLGRADHDRLPPQAREQPVADLAADLAETMTDYHRRVASGMSPARALAEATAADPLRRPFILLGAG